MQKKRILKKELIPELDEDQVQEAVNKAMSNAMEDVTKNFSDYDGRRSWNQSRREQKKQNRSP